MLPVMISLYNVRDALTQDFEGTLEKVAGIGYKYIEASLEWGRVQDPDEYKAAIDRAGLTMIGAHITLKLMIANPEKVFDDYIKLGCKYAAVPILPKEDRAGAPNYENIKREIARLGEIAVKKGLIFVYHNHAFEFTTKHNGKYMLDDIYDSIPANVLQTQIDVCWATIGGVNPVEYILKYSGRAPVVHLKDFGASKEGDAKAGRDLLDEARKALVAGGFPYRPLGQGIVDIPAVIKAAEKAGARWLVVELDLPSPGKTSFEDAKTSWDYLQSLNI
jgi:sugar phosphate isomerase/epimerase